MRRRKAEDDPAFEALFRTEFAPLVRAMTLLCGDTQAAADAVQDAFLQAHRHWSRVSALERPAAWVRRAAINRVRNQVRGRARQLAALPHLVEPDQDDDQPAAAPELTAALARLPKQQREAIVLYYLLDQPTRTIAQELGVTEATVRSHLRHGRDQLQAQLGEATR